MTERHLHPVEQMPATDGRVPGRRGQATRLRLLQCTKDLLNDVPYRDLKVVDIARAAGTSTATFYQYFPDVEGAVLVLAEDAAKEIRGVTDLLVEGDWKGAKGRDTARGLVRRFFTYWDEHRPVMRVVEMATAEGQLRFSGIRVRALNELTTALAEVVEEFKRKDRVPAEIDSMATAGTIVATLAHTAAHQYGFEFWGIRSPDVETSLARMVYVTVTGQRW